MATTYSSPQVTSGLVRGNWRGGLFVCYGTVTTTTAALNDIYKMCIVPNGFQVIDVILDSGDLDSNASPTIVLAVGDASTPARFITGSTVAQAGGIQHANVAGTVGYTYTLAEGGQFAGGNAGGTVIEVKVTTAAATYQQGTISVAVLCYLDPQLGGFT